MGGNSFQALLTKTDQLKFFMCVKEHLKYNGLFSFVTRNPEVEDLVNVSDDFLYWHAFTDPNGVMVKVYGKHTYDNQNQIAKYYTKRVWDEKETITEICLRYTSCKEIMHLLEVSGLEASTIYGDFDKTVWTKKSPSIIFICKLKQ
jgi:hypothetical protein